MQLKLSSPKIWLATKAVDFRRSIDGLCEIVETHFGMNLKEGIFIFYNRDRRKLKLLTWHRNGFVLVYKRLEQGRFTLRQSNEGLLTLDEKQLSWLLAGLDWASMTDWKELEFNNYF
jgi:transposase